MTATVALNLLGEHPLGKGTHFVIPAQAGTQGFSATSPVTLDPRLRGDDQRWMAGRTREG